MTKGIYIRTEEHKKKMSEAKKGSVGYWLGKHLLGETKKKMSAALSGEKNPNWIGGCVADGYGYVYIKKRDHPNCNCNGYIYEHRLVMEEFLGRYLAKEEVVHHINEIRDNNRIENLMLFANNKEHKAYHALNKKVN